MSMLSLLIVNFLIYIRVSMLMIKLGLIMSQRLNLFLMQNAYGSKNL